MEINLPGDPEKVWEYRSFRCKLSISGQVGVVLGPNQPSTSLELEQGQDPRSLKAAIKREISGGITAAAGFDSSRFYEAGQSVDATLGRRILRSLDVSFARKFNLSNSYFENVSIGTSLDRDFCFFQVGLGSDGARLSVSGATVQLPRNITLSFGPSRQAWLKIAEKAGSAAVRRFLLSMAPEAGAEVAATAAGSTIAGFARFLGIAALAVKSASNHGALQYDLQSLPDAGS